MGTRNVRLEETDRTLTSLVSALKQTDRNLDVARECLETSYTTQASQERFYYLYWFNYFQANYHEICGQL